MPLLGSRVPPIDIESLILYDNKLYIHCWTCTEALYIWQHRVLFKFLVGKQYIGSVPQFEMWDWQAFPELLQFKLHFCSVLPTFKLALPVCMFKKLSLDMK